MFYLFWKYFFEEGNLSPVVFYEYSFLHFTQCEKLLCAEFHKILIDTWEIFLTNFTNVLSNRSIIGIH